MNIRDEYLQGSPLDHPHCVTCVRRACSVRADDSTSCHVVDCPRGCAARYHGCKEGEHRALCPEERVPCINSGYGCPLLLPRKRLSHHLTVCPASVVFCSAEWNRCPMDGVQPGETADVVPRKAVDVVPRKAVDVVPRKAVDVVPRKAVDVVPRKAYTDCGQLDTAQAMRDHRALVDMLLAPLQTPLTQIFPAAPLGRSSPLANSEDGARADLGIEEDSGVLDSNQSWLSIQTGVNTGDEGTPQSYTSSGPLLLADSTLGEHTLTSAPRCTSSGPLLLADSTLGEHTLTSAPRCTSSGPLLLADSTLGEHTLTSAPRCTSSGPLLLADSTLGEHTLTSAPRCTTSMPRCWDDSGLAAGVADSSVQDKTGSVQDKKRETAIRDGAALNSVLSVSMEVECITKYQPKPIHTYTFLCGQEMRREEFPHHFHTVHNRILPDLNSWMEQRCPLAYLGCPFSFRRFRPATGPSWTLRHSWLLDSYGMTSQSADLDFDPLHRTPPHLLPTCVETVAMENSTCSVSDAERLADGQIGEAGVAPAVSQLKRQAADASSSGVNDVRLSGDSHVRVTCDNDVRGHTLSAGQGREKCDRLVSDSGALTSDSIDPTSLSDSGALTSDSIDPTSLSDSGALTSDSIDPTSLSSTDREDWFKGETFSALLDSISLPGCLASETSPVHSLASEASPGQRLASEASPVQCLTSEASPVQGLTSEASPVQGLTSEASPVQCLTSEASPGQCLTSEASPGQCLTSEASPVQGLTSEASPVQCLTSEASPGQCLTSEASPVQGLTSETSPVQCLTSEASPVQGLTSETSPVQCLTSEASTRQCLTSEASTRQATSAETCSTGVNRRQVIYTATGPHTAVRVHWVPVATPARHSDTGWCSKVELGDLPVEVLRHVAQFLDSFSLSNLSLVSRSMRQLCCSLLTDRGMVSLIWARQRQGQQVSWQVTDMRWCFSTCCERVDSWSFTGHNPISDHLVTCSYNQDRFRPSSNISIIPLTQIPMDCQIRSMLQERLNRRRSLR
ncbi:mucin-22-like isoform X2 [Littorina saxatilis]|uniref:mucin-22-like isoform X2 n=1 Tax=Littorina saxatilis TaxID=31220 RepID=UPI0038B61B74